LKSEKYWRDYTKSGKKPDYIPALPNVVYADSGWAGLGDWLGTNTIATHLRKYRPFEEARAFVHGLGFKSKTEWEKFKKSGKKPDDIPANPYKTYANFGWVGWGDWLGTGRVRYPNWRSFEEAQAYVRSLGLKSAQEWRDYTKSDKKPQDIPANPNVVYADSGWSGIGDWLGTCRVAAQLREYRSFEEARAFVRSLGLKSEKYWRDYTKSGKKPDDIPSAPNLVYANSGWAGLGDWLGTGYVAHRLREYRSFEEARAFARSLGLGSYTKWRDYIRSGQKPADIPSYPDGAYKDSGWISWGDWLGTDTVASFLREYRSFEEARQFVRSLGLKSVTEWEKFKKSGKKPDDIPAGPSATYANSGWISWGDWLGTGRVADQFREYRPFEEARAPVRSLGMKSGTEWRAYCKSGHKPADIPSAPWQTYADSGWAGMSDWLGRGSSSEKETLEDQSLEHSLCMQSNRLAARGKMH
jgi:hypothetical protein